MPTVQSGSEHLSVKYKLNRWDVFCCRMWVIFQNRIFLAVPLVMSSFQVLIVASEPEIKGLPPAARIFGLTFLWFLVLFAYLTLQTGVIVLLILFRRNYAGVIGEHEVEIRDNGLFARSAINETLYNWSGVRKISCLPGVLFVYVGELVYYIRRRDFSSGEQFQNFKAEIERRAKIALPAKRSP
jgi:hypothetical protein